MRTRFHDHVATFAACARPLLDPDPARNTLALTTLDRICHRLAAPAVLVTVERRGEVAGAALRAEGRPLAVSALAPRYAAHVERDVAGIDPGLPGATGPTAEVEAYAAAYTARTGLAARVVMRMRLFRLAALSAPDGVPGSARLADEGDVELLAAWQRAFGDELGHAAGPASDPRPSIREAVLHGAGYLLWELDRRPVAYAGARRPIAGMSRIGPVYTPPEHRGRGYGSAVTAATAAWALSTGARDVVLFTDLANPVSNAIYPRIGFAPVARALEVAFG